MKISTFRTFMLLENQIQNMSKILGKTKKKCNKLFASLLTSIETSNTCFPRLLYDWSLENAILAK